MEYLQNLLGCRQLFLRSLSKVNGDLVVDFFSDKRIGIISGGKACRGSNHEQNGQTYIEAHEEAGDGVNDFAEKRALRLHLHWRGSFLLWHSRYGARLPGEHGFVR